MIAKVFGQKKKKSTRYLHEVFTKKYNSFRKGTTVYKLFKIIRVLADIKKKIHPNVLKKLWMVKSAIKF